MKKLVLVVVALAVALSVVPVMAGDKSVSGTEPAALQALSKMPAPERTALITMTDQELASVEAGANNCAVFASCRANFSRIRQNNICVACLGVVQTNVGLVLQSN